MHRNIELDIVTFQTLKISIISRIYVCKVEK